MRSHNLTQADIEDIAKEVAKYLGKDEYVTARQAAEILGVSVSRIYQIKERLGYIKTGDNKQSPIRFNLRKLFELIGS